MGCIIEELKARNLLEQVSDEGLKDILAKGMVPFYTGYDPTSKSLQIGNLCAILTQRRLQLAGHKPVVIVGGATGMIGDPSGKSAERNLLDEAAIEANVAAQRKQLEKLLDFNCGENSAVIMNNHDWLGKFSFIEFLRDVGKRFRLGEMLAKESVKRRFESPEGMSFTEFTYQMLQAYDFMYLYREHGVRLQVGGGDQWGNITAGIDLVRKVEGGQAYGLVIPLITDSQGKKFGKSEGNAIYLDPEMTSPYQMYQYLINTDDQCVIRYLKAFTFLSLDEIAEIEKTVAESPEKREAQKTLASELTKIVHGEDGLKSAEAATKIFFGEKIENLSDKDLLSIFKDVPSVSISKNRLGAGINIMDLLAETPLFASKSEARRSLQQNGVSMNNSKLEGIEQTITMNDLASESTLVLRKGKKNYCIVKVE
ncbi:MAG: tyrosine--tRNA ligase [Planctomycetes bacterium]|nr:tyrosine--tRNA ligase [Planctomycetota bacterium]